MSYREQHASHVWSSSTGGTPFSLLLSYIIDGCYLPRGLCTSCAHQELLLYFYRCRYFGTGTDTSTDGASGINTRISTVRMYGHTATLVIILKMYHHITRIPSFIRDR